MRADNDMYEKASQFIRTILTWFVITNLPLLLCGLVIFVYSFHPEQKKRDDFKLQQVYQVCVCVTLVDALVNPIVFLQNNHHEESLKSLFTLCCQATTVTCQEKLVCCQAKRESSREEGEKKEPLELGCMNSMVV